jgi:hypothetical protein
MQVPTSNQFFAPDAPRNRSLAPNRSSLAAVQHGAPNMAIDANSRVPLRRVPLLRADQRRPLDPVV